MRRRLAAAVRLAPQTEKKIETQYFLPCNLGEQVLPISGSAYFCKNMW